MTAAMRNSYAAHTDFGFLLQAIPSNPKAIPSDIDMIFERKKQFFVGEWKMPGEHMSRGQELTLKALSELDNFSVYIVQGFSNNEEQVIKNIYKFINGKPKLIGNGIERFFSIYRAWYDFADSR
jgi:hypothetical protein